MSQWQNKIVKPSLTLTEEEALLLENTTWDDMKFPFFGRRLDVSGGHLTYNNTELGVDFDDSSRYNELDQIALICQVHHRWKIGSNLHPHVHWIQSHSNIPNMLLQYRIYDNGEPVGAWNLTAATTHAFTYTSGSILQLSSWPSIDASSLTGVSPFVDVKIYRDVANTSTEFGGADPLTGDWLAKEFDIHYEIDSLGSKQEYVK